MRAPVDRGSHLHHHMGELPGPSGLPDVTVLLTRGTVPELHVLLGRFVRAEELR